MEKYYLDKIKKFRDLAVEPRVSYMENAYLFAKRYNENEHLIHPELRYADAYKYVYENVSINIDAGELILGKPSNGFRSEEEKKEFYEVLFPNNKEALEGQGQSSHMTVDYDLLLKLGTTGIKAKIEKLESETDDESKLLFYYSCKASLEALEIYAERYSEKAKEIAEKLMRGRQRIAEQKGTNNHSILT